MISTISLPKNSRLSDPALRKLVSTLAPNTLTKDSTMYDVGVESEKNRILDMILKDTIPAQPSRLTVLKELLNGSS